MIDPAARAVLRAAAAHVVVADVDHPAIDDSTAHHVFRVLRVRDGDPVTVTDGQGRWRACRAAGGELLAEPDAEMTAAVARSATTTVAFAIPKSDRPEWIVQKLTELGVARIVLLHAERSVVRWEPDRAARHVAKLRRVAVEALEQSRGVWLPDIVGPARQQLVDRYPVELRQPVEARQRECALAAFVGAEHRRLELL